jgi:hypothetical protein
MNTGKNDGRFLGRLIALALILGAAYGAHAISRGGLGCPLGDGSCCRMSVPHDESREAVSDSDDDAKLEQKAPVTPPAKAD